MAEYNTDQLKRLYDLKTQAEKSQTTQDRNRIHQEANSLREKMGVGSDFAMDLNAREFNNKYVVPSEYREKYTNQINDEISRYQQSANAQLGQLRSSIDSAIGRNNEYLENQLNTLQEQKRVGDQKSINLQNRRGGFYSGGLDYQLAENQRATQQASGNLQGEIASRNAELNQQYSNAAQQITDQVNQLRAQAPNRVRELVDNALAQRQQRLLQEGQLTGMYQGSPTLAKQQQDWTQNYQENVFDYNKQVDERDFLYRQARDQIADQQWKLNFDEDVRQFGLNHALSRQVQMGNLSQGWASIGLSRDRLNYQKEQDAFQNSLAQQELELRRQEQQNAVSNGGTGGSMEDAYGYINELNERFIQNQYDDYGNVTGTGIANEGDLYRSILGLNLSDDQTQALLNYYGINPR